MSLAILNVGSGDTKLTFDKSNPVERERCAKIVIDMMRRGFAILVQVGTKDGKPLYQSASGFDPETCEYIIAGAPSDFDAAAFTETPEAEAPKKKRGRPPKVRLDAAKTRAVGVSRSAGG